VSTQTEYVVDAVSGQYVIEGIPAGKTITVELATVDVFGNTSAYVSATGSATTVGDTTAPGVPTGLAASGAILGAILSWTANTEADLDHYELAQSIDAGSTYPVVYSFKTTVVALSQLTAATAYLWKIRAVDRTGNASAYSSTVTATPRTVQTADLTNALITTAKLVAGSVDATILAAASVTAANGALAANAVVLGKIATDAVDSAAIAASAVGNSELAAGAVTAAKITAGTITATQIAAGTITTNEIAALTIVAANIAAGNIVAIKIAAGTITSNEIAAATIVAANIAAGTITGTQIAATTVAAANIVAGTITSNEIAANTITAANILASTITGTQIAALTITAAELAAGSITASKLQSTLVLATTLVCGTVGAASVVIDSSGIKSYDSSGNLEVSIPSNGSDVYINAQVDAKSLLVTGNAVFNGAVNEISEAATLVLDSSQTNPSLAPVLVTGFPVTVAMPQDTAGTEPTAGGKQYTRGGLDYDSAGGAGGATKVFYSTSLSNDPTATSFYLLELKASDRTVNRSVSIPFPGNLANKDTINFAASVARMGTLLYVVSKVNYLDANGMPASTQTYVQTVTQSTFALATQYTNLTGPSNAVQVITVTVDPTSAAFTLTYNDAINGNTTTVPFVKAVNMTAAAIQTALRTATGDSGLTVTGTTNTGPFTVTFADNLQHNRLHATATAGVGTIVNTSDTAWGAWGSTYCGPVICSDGTNIWLVGYNSSDTHIRWNKYNSTMVKQGSSIDAGVSPSQADLLDAAAGSFDLGALRILTLDDDGFNVLSFDATGSAKANEVFPSRDTGGITYGDALGTGARFWGTYGFDFPDYALQPYSTWIQTASATLKYYAAYTFYDGHTEQAGTAAASTDLVAVTAHGFVTDTRVRFGTLTGGTGLLNTLDYFVLASGLTTNAFKVSLTSGGAAIDITVDYSAITVGTTHETQVSPRANVTVANRMQLAITPAAIPGAGGNNDPSAERYYILPNASDPGIGNFKRQAEGTGVQTLTSYNSSGLADPATNSFSTVGVPAQLNSGNTAQGFSIKGNGLINYTGTAFPANPATNDHFYRSDLQMEFYYDGTRWLSAQLYSCQLELWNVTFASGAPISATTAAQRRGATPGLRGGSDIYLVDWNCSFYITAGSALSGTIKWTGTLNTVADATNVTLTSVGVNTINSGTLSVVRRATTSINALMNNGTVKDWFQLDWVKLSTPGPLINFDEITYRVVAT
jgi:hypothetical protein